MSRAIHYHQLQGSDPVLYVSSKLERPWMNPNEKSFHVVGNCVDRRSVLDSPLVSVHPRYNPRSVSGSVRSFVETK